MSSFSSLNFEISADEVVSKFQHQFQQNFAVLKLVLDANMSDDIKALYKKNIEKHNTKQYTDKYPDSGFDLVVTEDVAFRQPFVSRFVDFQVKSEMLYWDWKVGQYVSSAFDLVPRSSISKTPLMLANHVGIIDSGYRGNLIGAFRYFPENKCNCVDCKCDDCTCAKSEYCLKSETRILQVCHPSRCSVYVLIVDESELSQTARGAGGFGSTGV